MIEPALPSGRGAGRSMRILITGGAGYIGCRLTAALLADGCRHDVMVVDGMRYGGVGLFGLVDNPALRVRHVDLFEWLESAYRPVVFDAVIHLAAIVGEPACGVAGPELSSRTNTVLVQRLLDNVRTPLFIFFSTCSNYGKRPGVVLTEDADVHPTSVYAETKIAAEGIVRAAGGFVLRVATVAGVSPRMRYDTLFNEIAYRAGLGLPVDIYGPGAYRPFIDLRAVCTAVQYLLSGTIPAGLYNLVGNNIRKRWFCDIMQRAHPHAPVRLVPVENKDAPRDYQVSGERFQKAAPGWVGYTNLGSTFSQVARTAPWAVRAPMYRFANVETVA